MMRKISVVALLMICLSLSFNCGKKNQVSKESAPISMETAPISMQSGMSGCFGTEQAKVERVFSAEDNGARFRAYQVKWKKQDIIVPDMFATTEFKEGDTITFLAQNVEVPVGEKKIRMLSFMMMDIRGMLTGK